MTLLIHTGGTIGMAQSADGLKPCPGLVEAAVGRRAKVVSFEPLVDSAAIGPTHWNRLLDLVEAEAGPVVITHGTDTMAYTGAALTQALAGWAHPVILTGSMHPLGFGKDAESHLELALNSRPPTGVWLAFGGELLPAGALVKRDTAAMSAFRVVTAPGECHAFEVRRFADRQIGIVTISPGMTGSMIAGALSSLHGAVIRVFGAGTIPPEPSLAQTLRTAVAQGCRLRAVSTCESGGLFRGAYAAGAALWEAGVENGGCETTEAAFIRLWLALSE